MKDMEEDKGPDYAAQFKEFTQGYTFKALFLVFLALALLIPLQMVGGLVRERSVTAESAEKDVMNAWGSELAAVGPLITLPGVRTAAVRKEGEVKSNAAGTPFTLVAAPSKLNIDAKFRTENRKRGIFSVPVFYGDLVISGTFDFAQTLSALPPDEEVSLGGAKLIIALLNQKGIRKIDRAVWSVGGGDTTLFFQPGNLGQDFFIKDDGYAGRGIHAVLPEFAADAKASFNIAITIQGSKAVRFLPLGQDTHADIAADWPSPSFQGSFLPGSSSVGSDGFEAAWDINYMSRDIPLRWKSGSDNSRDYSDAVFGVDFFRAASTYSLNSRAVQYAILFITVQLLALFLLEVLNKRRIHPAPYLLSGIAGVVFYLLLLSFSEQTAFHVAYLIAAIAITAMQTLYARTLLPSWGKSWYMGLVTAASYALLYMVLSAESYALLTGSVVAFVAVALVMFLTRKLNWYGSDDDVRP